MAEMRGWKFARGAGLIVLLAAAPKAWPGNLVESGDGYLRRDNSAWVLGSRMVEKTVVLEGGVLSTQSFRNKLSGREYIQQGAPSDEIRLTAGARELTGGSGGWSLVRDAFRRLAQGEIQLDLVLRNGDVEATKHYVLYPGTPIIREWLTIRNAGPRPLRIREPFFLESGVLAADASGLELYYLTGAGNYNGSQLLKRAKVSPPLVLDSFAGIEPYETGCYNSYLPLVFVQDPKRREGVFAGWDYLGHWTVFAGRQDSGPVRLAIKVAGYDKELAAGQEIETPKAFTGVFAGDLDAMGNLLLDWQYEYMWEYTSPRYFARTRWSVDWPMPWAPAGGSPSGDNWGRRLALDLRYIDLMREAGGEVLWDDAGWYDKWGSWRGPDWRLVTDYLKKYGMAWKLWFPTFLAAADSKVAQQHPDWLIRGESNLDQSVRATADWQFDLIKRSVAEWGDLQYRYDGGPATTTNDTDFLAADRNFRDLLERIRRELPGSGVDSCHGGGRWMSYDLARLSDSGEYADGGLGPYTGYYSTLLIPPDKLHNNADFDHVFYNPSSDRTHLAAAPMWYRDPGDGPDVEAIRKDWDLYRYLLAQGVAGRWSHVFRPAVKNDDPVWYFQRSNRGGSRALILTKHSRRGPAYYIVSQPLGVEPFKTVTGKYAPVYPSRPGADVAYGAPWGMSSVSTTGAVLLDTGIYQDPTDGESRFYGVPGESFGPLNFKYRTPSGERSYVTAVNKLGYGRTVTGRFFGMSVQVVDQPVAVTELGQYCPQKNHGRYKLMVVRAADGAVLGAAELDAAQGYADALGFKYAPLPKPVTLEPGPREPVIIYPRGLNPGLEYDVRLAHASMRSKRSGADLMESGIALDEVLPGELVFLNLPNHPGSGLDKTPPAAPARVTKRLGSNLGVQGIEIAWSPATDDNWLSHYEVLRDGAVVGKTATGAFFFDYKGDRRRRLDARYEVRSVDGDGNRSAAVEARQIEGEPETYRALGDFSESQALSPWRYEECVGGGHWREMTWDPGGYEGRWTGSGLAKIGRIWIQPGASADVSRTFIVPRGGTLALSGRIQKDPSAENGRVVQARILRNGEQVWPASGWAEVQPVFEKPVSYRLPAVAVSAGDAIRFVIKRTGLNAPDPVIWDPIVTLGGR